MAPAPRSCAHFLPREERFHAHCKPLREVPRLVSFSYCPLPSLPKLRKVNVNHVRGSPSCKRLQGGDPRTSLVLTHYSTKGAAVPAYSKAVGFGVCKEDFFFVGMDKGTGTEDFARFMALVLDHGDDINVYPRRRKDFLAVIQMRTPTVYDHKLRIVPFAVLCPAFNHFRKRREIISPFRLANSKRPIFRWHGFPVDNDGHDSTGRFTPQMRRVISLNPERHRVRSAQFFPYQGNVLDVLQGK